MYSTNKIKNRGILAGEVLNRWTDDGPDWNTPDPQEVKPSRTNSRREREQKYLQKKQKKHTLDD